MNPPILACFWFFYERAFLGGAELCFDLYIQPGVQVPAPTRNAKLLAMPQHFGLIARPLPSAKHYAEVYVLQVTLHSTGA